MQNVKNCNGTTVRNVVTRTPTDACWAARLDFSHFMVVAVLIILLGKPVRHLHSSHCNITDYYGMMLLWAHLCRGGLALSLLQTQSFAKHYTWSQGRII